MGPSLDLLNFLTNRLEHQFFEHRTNFFGNRTRTSYFWLRTIEHRTSNIIRPITTDFFHFSSKTSKNVSILIGIPQDQVDGF